VLNPQRRTHAHTGPPFKETKHTALSDSTNILRLCVQSTLATENVNTLITDNNVFGIMGTA
jgi:hypothetical protein